MAKAEKTSLEPSHEELEAEFRDCFGGSLFFEHGFIRATEKTFEITSILFGEHAASRGFDEIVSQAFGERSRDWHDLLEQEFNGIYSETHLGRVVHDLTAYADYGISLHPNDGGTAAEDYLRRRLDVVRALVEILPIDLWKLSGDELLRVIRKATARWKLDMGEPVNAVELSLLSGRKLQTIKNKLAGKPQEIIGNQKRIEAREALAWLLSVDGFRRSRWRDQSGTKRPSAEPVGRLAEAVFVPVASDGSLFHPGLKRDGAFVLDGPAGEVLYEDYHAALEELQELRQPQWKRPTSEGSWTWVRGVEWRRVEMSDLHQQI